MVNQESNKVSIPTQSSAAKQQRPQENGSIRVEAHFRIFDPKNNKVFVEGRA